MTNLINYVINLIYNHFFVLTVKIVHIIFLSCIFFGNERSQEAFIKCIMYSELIIKLFLLEKSSFEWKDIIKVK